jgi:hypothetical protein
MRCVGRQTGAALATLREPQRLDLRSNPLSAEEKDRMQRFLPSVTLRLDSPLPQRPALRGYLTPIK